MQGESQAQQQAGEGCVYAFNTYLCSALAEAAKSSPENRAAIKSAGVRAMRRLSLAYIEAFGASAGGLRLESVAEGPDAFRGLVLAGLKAGDLMDGGMDPLRVAHHARILLLVWQASAMAADEGAAVLQGVADVVQALTDGRRPAVPVGVIDPEWRSALEGLISAAPLEEAAGACGFEQVLASLGASKLGEAARALAGELDLSELEEAARNQDIAGMVSKVMSGGLLGRVTQCLAKRMESGEVDREALLEEAGRLIGSLGLGDALAGQGGMEGMVRAMTGGGGLEGVMRAVEGGGSAAEESG